MRRRSASAKTKNRRRPSSIDVARQAGVSQATVSRTYTKSESVSERTRKRVMAAAKELGYNPNALARGLIQSTTNMIGIVMLRFMNPFYSYMLKQFTAKLLNLGYVTMLFAIDDEQEMEQALPMALQYYVDGLIITSATLSSRMVKGCSDSGTPVVLLNRYTRNREINSVRTDNVGGAREVAEYLLERGFDRIAYLGGEAGSSTNRDRRKGFYDALKNSGRAVWRQEDGDYTYESGYELGKKMLKRGKRPDAIFCANDLMALGVLDVARFELGLRIPEQLSVVGFDDIPMAAWPGYSLSTYHQPIDALIRETIEVLATAIGEPDSPVVTKILSGALIERGSSGAAPGSGSGSAPEAGV